MSEEYDGEVDEREKLIIRDMYECLEDVDDEY